MLDVNSGSVHSVDDLAYDIIAMYETSSREEITGEMLKKYADDPQVTREEIGECLDSVEALKAVSYTHLLQWGWTIKYLQFQRDLT